MSSGCPGTCIGKCMKKSLHLSARLHGLHRVVSRIDKTLPASQECRCAVKRQAEGACMHALNCGHCKQSMFKSALLPLHLIMAPIVTVWLL